MPLTKNVLLLLVVLLTALFAYQFIAVRAGVKHCDAPYFFNQGFSPDAFEYQLPAANFALHGIFPYYGFMSDMGDYKLCAHPDSVAYFRDTQKAGSMVFVSKPPLYSLLLGVAYKLAGFQPCTSIYFNLICLVLIAALMPLTGFMMGRLNGLFAGAGSALFFLLARNFKLWSPTAETLTALLVVITFLLAMAAFNSRKPLLYFLLGLSLSLLILCKGYFALSLVFFSIYLLWQIITKKMLSDVKSLILLNVGAAFFIVLWMLYINPLLQNNIADRLAFHERLKATTPQVVLTSRKDGFDSTGNVRTDVADNLNKFHQYQSAKENGFVVITNQLGDYNILNVHNEFCTDGDFHPEWRIISTLFYNRNAGLTKHQKLWKFYSENPRLGLQITWAKLVNGGRGSYNFLFYVSLLLSIFLLLIHRFDEIMMPAAILLVNVFIVLIIIYGDSRFIQTVYAVSLVFCFVVIAKTVCNLFTSSRPR